MSRKYLGLLLGAALLAGATQLSQAATVVMDGFETANLTAPTGPAPAINTSGFSWGTTNYTQIVGMVGGQSTAVYGGRGVISQAWPGSNFTCKTGTYCLRFYYAAGQTMSEQRFFLGRHYDDVWVAYWIRVPENFYHGGMNNKFAAFWTNVYDGPGDITWQTRPNGGGSAKLVVQDGGTQQVEVDAFNNFITLADRGRWMQVAMRMRPATASGANNGVIEFYRRWSNETTFTRLYSKTNARFYEGGQGIHQGYLMGWANDPYDADTDWLIDDFTVSDTSLVSGSFPTSGNPTSPPATSSAPPVAPTLNVVVGN